jgi:hypothetical protein
MDMGINKHESIVQSGRQLVYQLRIYSPSTGLYMHEIGTKFAGITLALEAQDCGF